MKKLPHPLLVLALLALNLFLASSAIAQDKGKLRRSERPIPNRYIVVLEESLVGSDNILPPAFREQRIRELADDLISLHGGRADSLFKTAVKGFSAEMSQAQAEALSRDPRVKYVEEDFEIAADETQTGSPWGLDRIDQRAIPLDSYYNYLTYGTGVHSYVIDSGIRGTHVEFGSRVVFGADYVGDGRNGSDCNGHGTHVAGIVGGATYGVAKNVTIHNLRVLGCDGRGTGSAMLSAIDWVTNNHVKPAVANVSIGMDAVSTTVENAITRSIASGVSYSLSAGNETIDACGHSPGGRVPNAVTV